jgi:outer membrane receptor protein involved in Fe transport
LLKLFEMSRPVMTLIALLVAFPTLAQHSFHFMVKDSVTNTAIPGVSAAADGQRGISDDSGLIGFHDLPAGKFHFSISHIGYVRLNVAIILPDQNSDTVLILLEKAEEELEELIVESTRQNRSIRRIPTRIETLTEEIDEAASMEPSRIAHLITHSTGIQVQTTAASSNAAVVRIQGLQGRYTKILKDGFPLYGGFSGSLDILQIPPLDLRQVEYIKGSASTLYGGGAIAGILNLLSKKGNKDETLIHLNRSSIGSNDFNAFVSKSFGKWGLTNLTSYQLHEPFDADKDGYTDIPQVSKFNFNPKLFFYPNDKTQLYAGAVIAHETRKGGDIGLVKNYEPDNNHFYLDDQVSTRATTQFRLDRRLKGSAGITFKNSISFFNRYINIRENSSGDKAIFGGEQVSGFTEATYSNSFSNHDILIGLNYVSDVFKEKDLGGSQAPKRDEDHRTMAAFINHVWDASSFLSIESGLRGEYNTNKALLSEDNGKWFVLPRISALFKYGQKFTTRIGGGLGYRPLTIFNEEAEPFGYKNIQPINFGAAKPERSYGLNADIVYQSHFGNKVLLTINQMFFYNQIKDAVVFQPLIQGSGFINSNKLINSKGFETQMKLTVGKFTWFVGYTYTDAYFDNGQTKDWLTLVPKHSIKGDLLFVEEDKWRIGWDYEYKSAQKLSTGRRTKDLLSTGLVIERTIGNFVLFFNAENITDVRQSKYESLQTQPFGTTQFTETWAPLDGRFLNFGLKVKL